MVLKRSRNAIYELGEDGRLIEIQLQELVNGINEEEINLIKDYLASSRKNYEKELSEH